MLNLKKNYIKNDMNYNEDGSKISHYEEEELKEFNDIILNKFNERSIEFELLLKNYMKHMKMFIEYKLDFIGIIENIKPTDLQFTYFITDYYIHLQNKNIETIKLNIKWNIEEENKNYFINSLTFIVNNNCYYKFKYVPEEDKMALTYMGSEKNIYEPGNFINDIIKLQKMLKLNYGKLTLCYLKENEIIPYEETVIYKNQNIVITDIGVIDLNLIKNQKTFNLNSRTEIKNYNNLNYKLFNYLNKKVLNIEFNESTQKLNTELEKIKQNQEIYYELEKFYIIAETEVKSIFNF
jgi:hypothetical protein